MIEYIRGILDELTPTQATIEAHGVGYLLNISLNTYTLRLCHQAGARTIPHAHQREWRRWQHCPHYAQQLLRSRIGRAHHGR